MKLEGKNIIITGASSGIGEETARLLAGEGANVVIAARRLERLEELKEEIEADGGTALAVQTDVTKREEVFALVDAARDAFGPVDVIINNAGIMPLSYMRNVRLDEWEEMVDVNVKGVLYGIAAVLPEMVDNESGHIINVSSTAGRRLFEGGTVYCGTKFAVRAISEGLRIEVGPHANVRVTCIEPGAVATELAKRIADEELIEATEGDFDGVDILDPVDIAEAIHYAIVAPANVNVEELLVLPTKQPN